MWTDADHLARVRDPAIELLLGHMATLTDGADLFDRRFADALEVRVLSESAKLPW